MYIFNIGLHRVSCFDIMKENFDTLMQGEKADIFYCDPPWGEANLKYWGTINRKQNKKGGRNDYPLSMFLDRLFEIATRYTNDNAIIFIEYGIRWHDIIKNYGKKFNLINNFTINMRYKSGKKTYPYHLHLFSKKQIQIQNVNCEGMGGYIGVKIPVSCFAVPGGILLDPCCGLGYSARAALEFDMIFRGNELNYKRLLSTIKILKK